MKFNFTYRVHSFKYIKYINNVKYFYIFRYIKHSQGWMINYYRYIVLLYYLYIFGLLWFEHNFSSTQMRRLTNPALTRILYKFLYKVYCSENIRFERMQFLHLISFKLTAINHSANSLNDCFNSYNTIVNKKNLGVVYKHSFNL